MKGENIALRLLNFANAVLRIVSKLPRNYAANHIAKQLVRSATGSGSNYEEARGAESRADFVHKMKISAKEMRESHYWLRVLDHSKMLMDTDLSPIIREAYELVAILTSSAKTAQAYSSDASK
jgi:four helix bundle protein